MILVTVGTHNRGFDRLVRGADELAARIEELVVIQHGSSDYQPHHAARSFRFSSGIEMEDLTLQARVIIMHAAAGSLILALRSGKPLVVVPRQRKFKEVINDHQIELASALARQNRAILVMDPTCDHLLKAVDLAGGLEIASVDNSRLTTALHRQLDDWTLEQRES
ncbi:MAG: hypothetical protein JXB85_12570 [Anaerolineales bacterium]|nr:hypothetical protein [Anaerolineales bacterium]